MKLIVKFKDAAGIVEFLEDVKQHKLEVKNIKNLEYMVTPTMSLMDRASVISKIRKHPSIEQVVEVPRFTGFNASDF